jgi:hypothetical protein
MPLGFIPEYDGEILKLKNNCRHRTNPVTSQVTMIRAQYPTHHTPLLSSSRFLNAALDFQFDSLSKFRQSEEVLMKEL